MKSGSRANSSPTTPTPAFELGAKTGDPVTMYLNDIYTIGANLAGLPALSLPVPADGGVIASLQVFGGSEEQVLAFGRVIEAAVSA